MADAGFPLNYTLLQQIAQGMVNERQITQKGQGGGILGPRESTNNPRDRRNQRLQQQGAPHLVQTPLKTHIVGVNWVDRFLDCNPGFKKIYIRYQERARAAATNDIEL